MGRAGNRFPWPAGPHRLVAQTEFVVGTGMTPHLWLAWKHGALLTKRAAPCKTHANRGRTGATRGRAGDPCRNQALSDEGSTFTPGPIVEEMAMRCR